MDKHQEYVNDKAMYAYGKYLRGEAFEKARAIILKDDKVAFIKDLSNGNITIPGGGVDDGETLEQAVIREALEETNIVVQPIMQVGREEYLVSMQIGDVDFESARVAYAYLCEFVEQQKGRNGLEGEYAGKTEITEYKTDGADQHLQGRPRGKYVCLHHASAISGKWSLAEKQVQL